VLYLRLIILSVEDDVPVDSEAFLMIDFVNLKIKSIQSFRDAHKNRLCTCVFIWMSAHSIYICIVLIKKHASESCKIHSCDVVGLS
jgi:hypothetical protein